MLANHMYLKSVWIPQSYCCSRSRPTMDKNYLVNQLYLLVDVDFGTLSCVCPFSAVAMSFRSQLETLCGGL